MHVSGGVRVAFRAPRRARGPLTWGQTAIWEVLRWQPPGDCSLNLLAVCPLPPDRTPDDVRAAVHELILRHEALHTLFEQVGAAPEQVVVDSGALEIQVYEAGGTDPDQAASAVGALLRGTAFRMESELPLRIALVAQGARLLRIVLCLSHMAVDEWSLTVVRDDLLALLNATAPLGPPAQQPLERARYEASPEAQRRARRALAKWERGVRSLPADWLAGPGPEGESDDGSGAGAQWAELRSRGLAAAVLALAERSRLGPNLVLQALVALLLGIYRGRDEVGLRLIVATRFRPETAALVGAFNQNALLRVRLTDVCFSDYLGLAHAATLAAYATSECEPNELERLVSGICRERGVNPGGYCFYNNRDFSSSQAYRSSPAARPNSAAGPPSSVGADDPAGRITGIERLRHESSLTTTVPTSGEKGSTFFFFVNRLSERAHLVVHAEAGFLAPWGAGQFLLDLEWLALEALRTDAGPVRLAAAFAGQSATDRGPREELGTTDAKPH